MPKKITFKVSSREGMKGRRAWSRKPVEKVQKSRKNRLLSEIRLKEAKAGE